MLNVLTTGFTIGLLASIPLGPIGVLCVQRTITKKFSSGFASALGAVTADTIYATIALFCLAIVMPYVDAHITIIKIVGGVIIGGMGVRIFLSKYDPHQIKHNRQNKLSLLKDYFSVLLLTISNPAYIFIFLGIFAAMKIENGNLDILSHLLMILGVFVGAATWWFIVTFSVNLLRKKFRARHIYMFNKLAGAAIIIFGIAAIIKTLIDTIK